jgi:hypothetical protein
MPNYNENSIVSSVQEVNWFPNLKFKLTSKLDNFLYVNKTNLNLRDFQN